MPWARVPDDAQDVVALLEEARLLDQAVVAELFAVVGGDEDEGVLPLARGLQRGPQSAELVIDLGDHAEILGLEPGHLGGVFRRAHGPQQAVV